MKHPAIEWPAPTTGVPIRGNGCKTVAAQNITLLLMKRIPVWRWRLQNKTTGRTYISHRFMTEAEALAKDPQAVRIEWLKTWKWVTADAVGSPKAEQQAAAPERRQRPRHR